jgi:EpsI family protein
MISWNARFATVALLLAGTALFLQARARSEFVLPRTELASFPVKLQNWAGTDVFLDDESLKTLRPGDFLQRTYRDETGGTGYVDLYVAYLQNQHALFHHLPQDCLEGSGWSPVESGTTTLAFPGEAPFPANRYLIAKGDDRQLVLFWYSARGRRVASEDWMNIYLALDSLRSNRTDNAVIRMNTELQPGEKPAEAERRLLSFAGLVSPLLKKYIPL